MITGSRVSIDVGGRIVGVAPVEALPQQIVKVGKAVSADDDHLVAVDLLHAAAVVGNHLAQFRQDQVEDLRQAQRAAERLGRRTQRLGLIARSALRLEQACILDRRRGLGREGCHELREILVVEIGFELVESEDADDAVAEEQRRTDPPANATAAVYLARKMRVTRYVAEARVAASSAGPGCSGWSHRSGRSRLREAPASRRSRAHPRSPGDYPGSPAPTSCRRGRPVAADRESSRTCPAGSASCRAPA